ncbi:hypothetical protein ABTB65_19010, partial [Acinetobacter baumannii]
AASSSGTVSRGKRLIHMDKFFLAIIISAVLLLTVAAGLLVNNGNGLREPTADVARVLRAPGPAR